jgi:hypothetical protein
MIKYQPYKKLISSEIGHFFGLWSFPDVSVGKSDKTKRLCVNYKRLNDVTVNEPFPKPLIGDILDRVGSS